MSRGKRARRDGVTVVAAPSEALQGPRVGLVANVNRGGAVARNRARRRLREAIRAAHPRLRSDIVVSGGPETIDMEFQELVTHVTEALTEAGVECGK
jgi:ribonuclease P protein component